ncbi:alpha-fibrinogenase albofibrase-like [Mugil cephalus]|uniref:alpha-fibrinogenase albofibrase-like n=1 Tax=Mugil cephalus TaxID=48193 RepID=UPI001FB80086|nr:alpha-fibrinogenase albofibrase-like [Mugil cephalus]
MDVKSCGFSDKPLLCDWWLRGHWKRNNNDGSSDALYCSAVGRYHSEHSGGCAQKNRWRSVVLGVHPGPGESLKITTIKSYIKRKHIFRKKIHDIVLLKLPEGTQAPATIDPADCNAKPKLGDVVQIAGHASTHMDVDIQSPTLQCVNVYVVDCTELRKIESRSNTGYEHQHWFCGQATGRDIRGGDSGGGVVFNGRLYGLIAFSVNATRAGEDAIGFLDLCHPDYLQWIETTIATPKRKKCSGFFCG